jgi:hypothetical protein
MTLAQGGRRREQRDGNPLAASPLAGIERLQAAAASGHATRGSRLARKEVAAQATRGKASDDFAIGARRETGSLAFGHISI